MKRQILIFIGGLLLAVILVLFMHSETPLFDDHNEECNNVDICLILEKANFDSHFEFNKNIKVFHTVLSPAIFSFHDMFEMPGYIRESESLNLKLISESLNLSNHILRI